MTWTSIDRWTCPTCRVTEVPVVDDEGELPAAIRAIQQEHAADHPAPYEEPTRDRHPVRQRRKAKARS